MTASSPTSRLKSRNKKSSYCGKNSPEVTEREDTDQVVESRVFPDRGRLSRLSESEANTQEAIRLAEVAKDDLGKVYEMSGQWQWRQQNWIKRTSVSRACLSIMPVSWVSVSHWVYLFPLRSRNACFVCTVHCKKRRIAIVCCLCYLYV